MNTPDGKTEVSFCTVTSGVKMGAGNPVDNPEELYKLLSMLEHSPGNLTGGGMATPMGDGHVLVQLSGSRKEDNTLFVEHQKLWAAAKPTRYLDTTRSREIKLNSYELRLPETAEDAKTVVSAVTAFHSGELQNIDPERHQLYETVKEYTDVAESLSPGDVIDTPEYATTLSVCSEPFETYTITNKVHGDVHKPVVAVTVSNPRGGFYNFAVEQKSDISRRSPELHTCHLGRSKSSPPAPNTPFYAESSFSIGTATISSGTKDVTVIEPDEEFIDSPLPHPRIQTPLTSIGGVGEKTVHKLIRSTSTDHKLTAEIIAHDYFISNDHLDESLHTIIKELKSLPRSKEIFESLETHSEKLQ
jgi:hypothetical protein